MMSYEDAEDDPEDAGQTQYGQDQDALFIALAELMEERELDEEMLVPLLIDAVYHYRALAYVAATAQPSGDGLRMDLDRLRKMIEEAHRGYRKDAPEIVKELSTFLDEMARELDLGAEIIQPGNLLSDGTER